MYVPAIWSPKVSTRLTLPLVLVRALAMRLDGLLRKTSAIRHISQRLSATSGPKKDLGKSTSTFTSKVPSHAVVILRVTPSAPCTARKFFPLMSFLDCLGVSCFH